MMRKFHTQKKREKENMKKQLRQLRKKCKKKKKFECYWGISSLWRPPWIAFLDPTLGTTAIFAKCSSRQVLEILKKNTLCSSFSPSLSLLAQRLDPIMCQQLLQKGAHWPLVNPRRWTEKKKHESSGAKHEKGLLSSSAKHLTQLILILLGYM